MSDLKRVYYAYKNFNHLNKKKFGILHCVSSYPALKEDINLNCITNYKKNLMQQ